MAEDLKITAVSKEEKYKELLPQIKALVQGESDVVANMANVCAALKFGMGFFWVGFYLVKDNELVLGPFQGPIACTRIQKGRGVCGSSWQNARTHIVEDVEKFPGHIACSSLSKSEVVIPIFRGTNRSAGRDVNEIHPGSEDVIGLLDVDSDELNGFDVTDETYLKQILELLKF